MLMTFISSRLWTLAIVMAAATSCGAADETLSRVQLARLGKAATAFVEVKAAQGQGSGTAFCIHPDGWFLTNAHVAQGEITLVLDPTLKSQKVYSARSVRSDPELDLALLHIDGAKSLPALALGSDEGLEELTEVIGFGFPFGKRIDGREYPAVSVNVGSINALRHKDGRLHRIQLDAAVTRGNSGGPVLDQRGKVVGVIVSGVVGTEVNFAIPVSAVKRFLERPEVQFNPPRLGAGDLHKPVRFEARVTPLLPSTARLTVELILKAGNGPERTEQMKADGDRYRLTTVPIPGQAESRPLRMVAQFENAKLEVTTTDRSFKVGRRELALGDVRSIHPGSPSRVVLRSGESITGALVGLETVPALLSGQTMAVDLTSAREVTITPVGKVEQIACTLVVRQGEKEIHRQGRALSGRRPRDVITGAPAGNPLSTPCGVVFGPDGDLFVLSQDAAHVLRYDGMTGSLDSVFVGQGSGGLRGADEMVFGPDGHLYVPSPGTRNVLRYDGMTGAFLGAFVTAGSGGLNGPHGLAFGPDSNLYVADPGTATILKYDGRTGASLGTFASGNGLNDCVDLTFGPEGNLYVSNRGRGNNDILEFNGRTGAFIKVFATGGGTGLKDPHGLAFGPDGNLYVAGEFSDNVLRFNGRTGALIDVFVTAGSGGLAQPVGLTFREGHLFVGSYRTGQVLRYNGTTGAFVDVFTKNAPSAGLGKSQNDESGTGDGAVYLCDMRETHSSVGQGAVFGKNGDLGFNPGNGDQRIMVNGVLAKRGLSMHATARGTSFARYRLDGNYTSFHSVAAANDSIRLCVFGRALSPMTFSVVGDGRELWRSRPLQRPGESQPCAVNVTGVRELELRLHYDGDRQEFGHAVWVDPYVQ
jgi:DNA-binding beta-propeller fold protein YncE